MVEKHSIYKEKMHIVDAIDHLSHMAELDTESSREEFVFQGIKTKLHALKELTPSEREKVLLLIKKVFHTIHHYLKHIYHKEDSELKDIELQQGVQAMMRLAIEAAEKLKTYTSLFEYTYKEGKLTEIKEYNQLEKFYVESVVKRFQELISAEEMWESQWEGEDLYLNIERVGLKDLDTVKRDQQYELFSIRQEDGSSFFNRNLLRHIKLITDFDHLVSDLEGEDPLLMGHLLNSKQAQEIAISIKMEIKNEVENFYLDLKEKSTLPLVMGVKKVLMPLMLASNEKNILTETAGKSSTIYLRDFHLFLRNLLASEEYQHLLSYPFAEVDELGKKMIDLVDKLCHAIFIAVIKKGEWIDYIYQLVERVRSKAPKKKRKSMTAHLFLKELLDIYDSIDQLLKRFPNGPLFKAIDLFRAKAEAVGFDPILQGNSPYQLYEFMGKSLDSSCLRVPCPTRHQKINVASVIEEFKGYLRILGRQKKQQRHLLINLQDPTSWQEHTRCFSLHELAQDSSFNSILVVVTLPKRGDFYYQADNYAKLDSAEDFLVTLEQQIKDGESCGFFFSSPLKKGYLLTFCHQLIPLIHSFFFENKEKLKRKERLDFIEIFYLFLTLKVIDLTRPTYFSFSCKDAVDSGAAASAAFFALLKLISGEEKWNSADQDCLVYLFFCPALMVRERLIDSQRFNRVMSALAVLTKGIEESKKAYLKALSPLYSASFFQHVKIE